jgi:glycerate 2-kinase
MQCIAIKVSITAAVKMTHKFDVARFDSFSIRNHPQRDFIQQVLASTFDSINPYDAVKKYLQKNPLPFAKRTFAFGLGKAAIPMTQAVADEISLTDSLVITKHASPLDLEPAIIILGDHPIPSDSSLQAGIAAKKFLSQLTKDDLLICLISGGGSALMTAPLIPLADLQKLTSILLECGANIDEINTIRRHLDELKGGGVANLANGAKIISLILSDVVGDSLETIASGITAPDPTTCEDAIVILAKYQIKNEISTWRETVKPNDSIFEEVINQVLVSNQTALESACSQIKEIWSQSACRLLSQNLQGEASEIGKQIAAQFKSELGTKKRPFCLLAGGETTVTIKGDGKGGRNQELALSTLEVLSGLEDVMLISIATDGEDGPTDAAGAVVTGESYQRAKMLGLDVADYRLRNDAYHFFETLGDLIKTGPSGTNVNDLVFCFAF